MDWDITTSHDGGFYKAVVKCPAGYRRNCTSTTVTADHTRYQLLYVVDPTVTAESNDEWSLPIRHTGGDSRDVDVEAMLLGNLVLGKDKTKVDDGSPV